MCGICGAAWTDPARALDRQSLERMNARISKRGPDDAGTYLESHAALAFRRLAIIDIQGSHQPIPNEDQSVWMVFNGEIYNYQMLRHRLEANGHRFRSTGDSEVIVHLYEDEGPDCFKSLRGMFAVAIWDAPRRSLILARDRLGQKPLVYSQNHDRITFSSEIKALLELPANTISRDIDAESLDQYLTYGYVPHPRTILSAVKKLPPAHYATWRDGRLTIQSYWEPNWAAELERPEREDLERLRELLTESVREQMISDVPLGAFLSGGIDSTIIAGLMQRASSRPVKTFTIGFRDPAFDESRYAEIAAKHLGTEHQTFIVDPESWEAIPALAEQFDEPFADSSALPTWYVSRETRKHVTVALSGDAGDELFAGYDRYRALALSSIADRFPPSLRSFLAGRFANAIPTSSKAKTRLRALKRLLETLGDPPIARYTRWMTLFDEPSRMSLYADGFLDRLSTDASTDPLGGDPATIVQKAWNLAANRDVVTRAMVSDLMLYLPGDLLAKVDQASMANSLEVRGPFLDHRVVELAMAMPIKRKLDPRQGRSKIILKKAFADLLPREIQNRSKMGFGVPLDRWFRADLYTGLHEILTDPITQRRGLFRQSEVERMLAEHHTSKRDHAYRLWALLMLELWFRTHLDPSTRADDQPTPVPEKTA
jgi:asparagine synthase (glutamine-hydrolysing)